MTMIKQKSYRSSKVIMHIRVLRALQEHSPSKTRKLTKKGNVQHRGASWPVPSRIGGLQTQWWREIPKQKLPAGLLQVDRDSQKETGDKNRYVCLWWKMCRKISD